ncbi:hypothetical protein C1H76_0068 [Elsinoe australis]|uniref:Uncharacterized protein n=1 Tax=Elsinoe australis TaxID=40998 RepID=A0A4U7BG07_9PEZI|nr:hypothetical protein C1H76_0068 [Elsinoe australis]
MRYFLPLLLLGSAVFAAPLPSPIRSDRPSLKPINTATDITTAKYSSWNPSIVTVSKPVVDPKAKVDPSDKTHPDYDATKDPNVLQMPTQGKDLDSNFNSRTPGSSTPGETPGQTPMGSKTPVLNDNSAAGQSQQTGPVLPQAPQLSSPSTPSRSGVGINIVPPTPATGSSQQRPWR